jgi:hypothetical protein
VKKIRCETKRALDKFSQDDAFKRKIYNKMSIGYNFTFTITENNKFGVDAGFRDLVGGNTPAKASTFTLGIGAGMDRRRLGVRDFTFVDSFKEARDPKICAVEATGPNYEYPITGIIGLEEVIRTFLELQSVGLGNLPGVAFSLPQVDRKLSLAPERGKKEGSTVEFTETFEFTTTIAASASPKIVINPLGAGFELASASAGLSADRSDKHQLTITLAPNYSAAVASLYNQNVNRKLRLIEEAVR